MNKSLIFVLAAFVLLMTGAMAMGHTVGGTGLLAEIRDIGQGKGLLLIGIGLGCGGVLIGVGLGIGRIGGSALEALARQPEMADKIQAMMLIAAALVEGVALFGLVICLLGFFTGSSYEVK